MAAHLSQRNGSGPRLLVCDGCHDAESDSDELPEGWRYVWILPGWIGAFHACSDACEETIRERHERR